MGEITIRRAAPDDIPIIVELGLEALDINAYPHLLIDVKKVKAVALECVSSQQNYCWVAEHEGVVVASVGALVHEMTFHERKQASVVQFYTRHPDAGIRLIRHFLTWARGRAIIKMIVFTLEMRADPRIGKLLKRLGLEQELPVYLEIR